MNLAVTLEVERLDDTGPGPDGFHLLRAGGRAWADRSVQLGPPILIVDANRLMPIGRTPSCWADQDGPTWEAEYRVPAPLVSSGRAWLVEATLPRPRADEPAPPRAPRIVEPFARREAPAADPAGPHAPAPLPHPPAATGARPAGPPVRALAGASPAEPAGRPAPAEPARPPVQDPAVPNITEPAGSAAPEPTASRAPEPPGARAFEPTAPRAPEPPGAPAHEPQLPIAVLADPPTLESTASRAAEPSGARAPASQLADPPAPEPTVPQPGGPLPTPRSPSVRSRGPLGPPAPGSPSRPAASAGRHVTAARVSPGTDALAAQLEAALAELSALNERLGTLEARAVALGRRS